MPEQKLSFCLDDLTAIRLRCRKCNAVIELHPEKLATGRGESACCGDMAKEANGNPFQSLADAIARIRALASHASIEFVVSKPAGPPPT